jgi:hypothetical protein
VSITVGSASSWDLTGSGRKVKGVRHVDLTWKQAATAATSVDVYRNGTKVDTTTNDGSHTDGPLGKGGGSFTYKLCPAGATTNCSDEVTVTF